MATAQTRPRFRSDLVATPLEMGGHRFIDVTDPDSEETFRFYEVEYSIACAMDGKRDVGKLIDWAKQELGLEPEPAELETVISTLADLGYLDAGDGIELGAPGGAMAAAPARAASGVDVELGASGASSMRPERPAPPEAPALELGAPGKPAAGKVTMGWDSPPVSPEEFEELVGRESLGPAGIAKVAAGDVPPPPAAVEPKPTLKARGVDDEDEEGPTHIPEAAPPEYDDDEDVSVDLSDHLAIGADDVKEAVRQSKVMKAVEVPADLAAVLDEDADEQAPASKPLEPEKLVAAAPKVDKRAEKKEPPKVEVPAKPAADKKKEPAAAKPAAAKEAPVEEKKGSSAALLIVLLILVGGAAGAYWYLNIYKKDADKAPAKPTTGQSSKAGAGSGQQATRPPAGPPAVRLVAVEADAVEVVAGDDGIVAMIGVEGDEVEEGAVVAQLKGVAAVERSLVRPRRKFEEYSAELEAAKQSGNERKIAASQKKVDEKRALIEAGEEKLAKLNMMAPTAGTIVPLVQAGAKVGKDEPVVRIVGEPALSATFVGSGKSPEVGAACEIAPKNDPAKPIRCIVDSVEGDSVTVRVPRDVGFAAGDEVVLK